MATCGSLQQHIFDIPFKPVKSIDHPFTDLFDNKKKNEANSSGLMNSESLQMCTEGLGFESLDGVEDFKNNEASNGRLDSTSMMIMSMKSNSNNNAVVRGHSTSYIGSEQYYYKKAKGCIRSLPPPISSLGGTGKPSVCFKSYRQDGRFVLQEVRIPKQEYLHACREDGRLRLSFVQPDDDDDDDDILDKEDEEGDGICEEESDDDHDEGEEIDMIEEHVNGIS